MRSVAASNPTHLQYFSVTDCISQTKGSAITIRTYSPLENYPKKSKTIQKRKKNLANIIT
jgi:hypothetical protein